MVFLQFPSPLVRVPAHNSVNLVLMESVAVLLQILDARSEQLTKKQRQLATGETRQFDHRPLGQRNPLFERLGENERRCLPRGCCATNTHWKQKTFDACL